MEEKKLHVIHRRTENGVPAREKVPIDQRQDLQRAERFLRGLVEACCFGKVTISMQNGRILEVKVEQTLKIDEIR